jgi:hypothetical protein
MDRGMPYGTLAKTYPASVYTCRGKTAARRRARLGARSGSGLALWRDTNHRVRLLAERLVERVLIEGGHFLPHLLVDPLEAVDDNDDGRVHLVTSVMLPHTSPYDGGSDAHQVQASS